MPEPWGGYSNGRIPASAMRQLEHATYNGKRTTAFRLRKDAAMALDRLLVKAKADGYDTDITDAYRSYEAQVRLKAQKGVYAATPGTSNHGWAMAADCAFHASSKSFGRWLWANEGLAKRHGWFPPAWTHDKRGIEEPWHWEYDHTLDRHRNEPPEDDMPLTDADAVKVARAVHSRKVGGDDLSHAQLIWRTYHRVTAALRNQAKLLDMVADLESGDVASAKRLAVAVRKEFHKALEE